MPKITLNYLQKLKLAAVIKIKDESFILLEEFKKYNYFQLRAKAYSLTNNQSDFLICFKHSDKDNEVCAYFESWDSEDWPLDMQSQIIRQIII